MTNGFGMIIELIVAALLMLTIGYCMLLNRRLKLLKADEQSLRATISELVTATEIAERAIGGLKLTVEECEVGLSARLASAERCTADLDRGVKAGKDIIERLSRIATAGSSALAVVDQNAAAGNDRPNAGAAAPQRADARAVAAAAQAFADRLRVKASGRAA